MPSDNLINADPGSPIRQRSVIPSLWLKHFHGSLAEKLKKIALAKIVNSC